MKPVTRKILAHETDRSRAQMKPPVPLVALVSLQIMAQLGWRDDACTEIEHVLEHKQVV